MNELMTKVFVEQPRLHQVCLLVQLIYVQIVKTILWKSLKIVFELPSACNIMLLELCNNCVSSYNKPKYSYFGKFMLS